MTLNSFKERGAAAVEFALIAMLLISLLVGIVEGGRLFMFQASLASAARDGARALALGKDSAAAFADADAAFLFGSPSLVSSTPCPSSPSAGDRASYVIAFDTPTLTGMFLSSVDIKGKGVMRCGA